MRLICPLFALFFLTVFASKMAAQTTSTSAQKDSMNAALEAKLKVHLGLIYTEVNKMNALLEDSTQTGYFTASLNDSINAVYYNYDGLYGLTNDRIVWPVDTTTYATGDDGSDSTGMGAGWPMDSMPDFPPPGGMGKGMNFLTKKSSRTIFTWGYSWGVANAVGTFTATGSEGLEPNFDFGKSRHSRFALMLRTRLGKRDTMPNFDFGGGGKFDFTKLRNMRDQFRGSKINLKFGIVFDRVTLDQTTTLALNTASGDPIFEQESEIQQSKLNQILVRYIEFPLLVEFMVTKKVKLEAGPFAGLRTRNSQYIEYVREPFDIVRTRRENLGLRKYNYGLMLGFGLKSLYMDAKIDLSNVFENNPRYDYRLLSLGFTFGL